MGVVWHMIWYDTMQYHTIWYHAIRCDKIRYDRIQIRLDMIDTVRYSTRKWDTIWYNIDKIICNKIRSIWYGAIQYDGIQYDTIRDDAMGLDTIQWGTIHFIVLGSADPALHHNVNNHTNTELTHTGYKKLLKFTFRDQSARILIRIWKDTFKYNKPALKKKIPYKIKTKYKKLM